MFCFLAHSRHFLTLLKGKKCSSRVYKWRPVDDYSIHCPIFHHFYEPVWPDGQIGFSIFGHLQQWKFAQNHRNWPKVGLQLCQIRNKPLKYGQRFRILLLKRWNFAKSGHTENDTMNSSDKCYKALISLSPYEQCDQMARIFFTIWPFTKFAKVGPEFSQIGNDHS